MDKVQTIRRSLRCYWFSLFGLVPVLGLPLAVHSVFNGHKLQRNTRGHWNPARSYVIRGTVLGWFGIVISIATLTAIGLVILNQYSGTGSD